MSRYPTHKIHDEWIEFILQGYLKMIYMNEKNKYWGRNSLLSGQALTSWGASTWQTASGSCDITYLNTPRLSVRRGPQPPPASIPLPSPCPPPQPHLLPEDCLAPRRLWGLQVSPGPLFLLGWCTGGLESRLPGSSLDRWERAVGPTWLGSPVTWNQQSSLLHPSILCLGTSTRNISPNSPSCKSWLLHLSSAELCHNNNQLDIE